MCHAGCREKRKISSVKEVLGTECEAESDHRAGNLEWYRGACRLQASFRQWPAATRPQNDSEEFSDDEPGVRSSSFFRDTPMDPASGDARTHRSRPQSGSWKSQLPLRHTESR